MSVVRQFFHFFLFRCEYRQSIFLFLPEMFRLQKKTQQGQTNSYNGCENTQKRLVQFGVHFKNSRPKECVRGLFSFFSLYLGRVVKTWSTRLFYVRKRVCLSGKYNIPDTSTEKNNNDFRKKGKCFKLLKG